MKAKSKATISGVERLRCIGLAGMQDESVASQNMDVQPRFGIL